MTLRLVPPIHPSTARTPLILSPDGVSLLIRALDDEEDIDGFATYRGFGSIRDTDGVDVLLDSITYDEVQLGFIPFRPSTLDPEVQQARVSAAASEGRQALIAAGFEVGPTHFEDWEENVLGHFLPVRGWTPTR